MINLNKLTTETRNPRSMNLDEMSALEIVTLMNDEDNNVVAGVKEVLPEIAKAVQWCAESLQKGARMIYVGAGTSGRLGLLDSVECPPTFGVSPETVVGLIAGGEGAFIKAVEGAEDRKDFGVDDLKKINCNKNDIVIGIAASGRTPYVIGALDYAKEIGCRTVSIACNKGSEISEHADLAIEPVSGPEILTGSTRLKAGTAQKMVVNMLSTSAMILNGKAYQNLMVDVMQTNEKLVARAEKIIMEATGCDAETAKKARIDSNGKVKIAVTMILLNCSQDEAVKKLEGAHGHVRQAIK